MKYVIYKTEIDTNTKNKLYSYQRRKLRGINWELGINRYTQLYIKQKIKIYCIAKRTLFSIL